MVAFWRDVWTGTYGPSLGPSRLAGLLAGLERDGHRAMLTGTGERCLCAMADGHLAGTVIWRERGRTAYVWGMYVGLTRQRSGIGSSLLLAAAGNLTSSRCLEVRVLATSPWAVAFYRKHGFEVTGTERTALMDDEAAETLVMVVGARALAGRMCP